MLCFVRHITTSGSGKGDPLSKKIYSLPFDSLSVNHYVSNTKTWPTQKEPTSIQWSQILSNPLKSFQIAIWWSQILSNPLKSTQKNSGEARDFWGHLRGFDRIWDHQMAIWEDLRGFERIWDHCIEVPPFSEYPFWRCWVNEPFEGAASATPLA